MSLITPESVWNLQQSLQAKENLSTLSGSRMRENRPSGLMRGGARRSLALVPLQPVRSACSTELTTAPVGPVAPLFAGWSQMCNPMSHMCFLMS